MSLNFVRSLFMCALVIPTSIDFISTQIKLSMVKGVPLRPMETTKLEGLLYIRYVEVNNSNTSGQYIRLSFC